jgi:hypothetical protein
MKALLIDAGSRNIEAVDVRDLEEIARLIGFATIASDAVGKEGDQLYFDEDCFLRGSSGRFQVDSVIPVSGKAVLVGTAGGGAELRDVATDIDSLRGRIKYL